MRALNKSLITAEAKEPSVLTAPQEMDSIAKLDGGHAGAFREALSRILSTEAAEFTFAQLLDGLPTKESFREFLRGYEKMTHPIFRSES